MCCPTGVSSGEPRERHPLTPRLALCEVCRTLTERRVEFDERPRRVFLCGPTCERVFRDRLLAAREDGPAPDDR